MHTRRSMPVRNDRQVIPDSLYDGCHLPKKFVIAVAKCICDRFRQVLLQQLQEESYEAKVKPKRVSKKQRHIHYHFHDKPQLNMSGDLKIGTIEHIDNINSYNNSHSKPQPRQSIDRNRRAVLAVHQQCSCNAAEWAVVVKLLEEQGAIHKSAYQNAATYINEICGEEVTAPESIARSAIYTKIIGMYPNWRIKDGEQSRKAPNKLRKYLQIAQVFIEAQNA